MFLLSPEEIVEENLGLKSDEKLLHLSLTRPDVFGLLIDRYEKAFLRKAAYILGIRDETKDVVQDSFVKIYINAPKFKETEGSFQSWAYKILVNTCLAHYNKAKRRQENVMRLPEGFDDTFSDEKGGAEWEEKLNKDYVLSLLSRLPICWSRLIKWRFIDALPEREIAELEGVSEGAVRTRIYRAKEKLKKIATELE